MIQIRQRVYDTNSSSVHSITIVPTEEYIEFRRGEKWINFNYLCGKSTTSKFKNKTFVTLDEIIDILNKTGDQWFRDTADSLKKAQESGYYELIHQTIDSYPYNKMFCSYCDYGSGYERFSESYTTKNGDNITAFGYYGEDY